MNEPKQIGDIVHQVRSEHGYLHQRVADINALLDGAAAAGAVPADFVRLRAALAELRGFLLAHFEREERGGWLEEAVSMRPNLARQLTNLERQHVDLRTRIDELVALADQSPTTLEAWQTVREATDEFLKKLLAHERLEEFVLQQGFNQDLELDP